MQDWKTYKLGEIADIQNGYAFKSGEMGEKGIPVIKIKNIVPPNVVLEGSGYFIGDINDKLEKYIIKNGDFLISMTGSTVNVMSSAVGKMGKYRLNDIALLNQRAGKIYITDSEKANFDYLCHFLNRYEIHYNLALNANGSANQANISPAQIKNIEINLPPLPEQHAIASILSALDDKIGINLQMNKTLEEMAMALYKHWFVEFGPFQNGKFVDSELGMIPEGWEVSKLIKHIKVINGFAFKGKDFIDSGLPVLKIKNVKAGKILLANLAYVSAKSTLKAQKSKINFEDILITMTGNRFAGSTHTWVGKVAMFLRDGEFYLNQRVSKLIMLEGTYLSKYYLSTMLASDEFQYYFISNSTSSGGQANISPELIYNTPIIVPPCNEMIKFDEIVSKYVGKIYINELEIETLTKLRDTMLPKLISGEVRVKDVENEVLESL